MPENVWKPEIRIIETKSHPLSAGFDTVLSKMKVDELIELARPLTHSLQKYFYADAKNLGVEPAFIDRIRKGTSPKKADWVSFIHLFLHPFNFHLFLESMPENARTLLSAIAENHAIPEKEAVQIYGGDVTEVVRYYTTRGRGFLNFWLDMVYAIIEVDGNRKYEHCVGFAYSNLYQIFHWAWRADSRPVAELPIGLVTFSAEEHVFCEIPLLDSLYDSGVLSVGQNKLRTATYQKMVRSLHFQDFPSDVENKKSKDGWCTRTVYYPLVYALYRNSDEYAMARSSEGLVCDIADFLHDGNVYNFFKYYMPHLSGVKKNTVDWRTVRCFLNLLKSALSYLDDMKWGSVDYLCHLIRSSNSNSYVLDEEAFCTMNVFEFGRMPLFNEYTSRYFGYDELIHQIAKPAVRSVLYAWASLGLLEIACTPSLPEDAVSPFDSLQYVRLTELGKYALGKVNTYSPPKVQDAQIPFELSDDHLLIKVLNPESHLIVVLDRYAKQVAPTLYKAEEAHFISDCGGTADLEKKIQQFKNLFDKELPPIWTSFFDTLLKQSKAFSTTSKQYVLRRIDREDRRLQDIILSDSTLRKYILRAEDYVVLIEQKHMDEVSRIFRSYGYIL